MSISTFLRPLIAFFVGGGVGLRLRRRGFWRRLWGLLCLFILIGHGELLMEQNEKYLQIINEERLLYERIAAANRALEAKVVTLLQSSIIIIALIAAAKVITGGAINIALLVIVVIILALYLCMVVLAIQAWRPRNKSAPFNNDWDYLFEHYIHAEDEKDLRLRLANYVDAVSAGLAENKKVAELVTAAGGCLFFQILLLIALLIASYL